MTRPVSEPSCSGQVPPPVLSTGLCGSGRGHPYSVHAGITAPEISWSKMLTISLRRKVKTGRLRSCRRAADWLVPCIHLTLPVPPSLPAAPAPASTQLAASSRGSGEQFGGLGRAAEAMEASAGDDRDLRGPPPQRCRRGPNAKCGWGKGRLGGAAGAPSGQPALPAFRAAAAQLSAAGGLDRPGSPPTLTRPCLFSPPPQVADLGQAAAAATAEALRQAGPER